MNPPLPSRQPNLTRGYTICLVGTLIWSLTGVLIRHLTLNYHMPALVLAFWRDVFVVLTLLLVFSLLKPALLRIERRHLRFLLVYGVVLAGFNVLWTFSVALNGASVATVLIYSSPAYTALAGSRLFGERLGLSKIMLILGSLLGCVLVAGAYQLEAWQLNPLGLVIGLVSAIGFAAYSLMGKSASQRGIDSWTALIYTFAFAACLLLILNSLAAWVGLEQFSGGMCFLGKSLDGWGVLLLLAIGPTIGGFGLYTLSMNDLPAGVANLIATLEPVFTAAMAFVLLDEILTLPQLLGGALILGCVLLLHLVERHVQAAALEVNL
jgi:drug/metabolite transporter (DMT)-like permease